MPTVTDYSTILDSNFTLSIGGDTQQDFQFALPATTPRYPGILAFRVYPSASGTNLFFVVELNGVNVFQATLASDGTSFRTVHEIVDRHHFQVAALGSQSPEEVPSDAAEAVDADASAHRLSFVDRLATILTRVRVAAIAGL